MAFDFVSFSEHFLSWYTIKTEWNNIRICMILLCTVLCDGSLQLHKKKVTMHVIPARIKNPRIWGEKNQHPLKTVVCDHQGDYAWRHAATLPCFSALVTVLIVDRKVNRKYPETTVLIKLVIGVKNLSWYIQTVSYHSVWLKSVYAGCKVLSKWKYVQV